MNTTLFWYNDAKKDPAVQDRYVGDIGDFGKFQLFRYLFNYQKSPFKEKHLAQIWFLHQGEGEKNNDGKHIEYFERVMGSDEDLEYSLMDLLMRDKREVKELEMLKLLHNARFFYEEVPKALEDRYLWLESALHFASTSQVVAVEPDNGMALRCNRREQKFEFLTLEQHYTQKVYPHKYIFTEEIGYFYRLPGIEICIVYQHLNRCFAHDMQINMILEELRETYRHVLAIKHTPYSPRAFFFLCKSDVILDSLKMRLERFEEKYKEFWQLFL